MKKIPILALLITVLFAAAGCEKKVEESETYQEILKHNEEIQKQNDSLKRLNYKELVDSNRKHVKSLDSLKHITDSLKENLDKKIKDLKTKKYN